MINKKITKMTKNINIAKLPKQKRKNINRKYQIRHLIIPECYITINQQINLQKINQEEDKYSAILLQFSTKVPIIRTCNLLKNNEDQYTEEKEIVNSQNTEERRKWTSGITNQ